MGIFDSKTSEQIKYLEDERKKLWKKLASLENNISDFKKEMEIRSPEAVKESKQNSKKSAEYRNRTNERMKEANSIVQNLNEELEYVREVKEQINEISLDSNQQKINIDESKSQIEDLEKDYHKKVEILNSKIGTIDAVLIKYPELDEKLSEIEEFISMIEENNDKSGVTLISINKRKKEIDDLYREIFGYDDKDENGESIHIDGIKDEIEMTFNNLTTEISDSIKSVEEINISSLEKYEEFEKVHEDKYKSITEEIAQLLPNALTAGLSSAFSSKKLDEVESSKKHLDRFTKGIYLLLGVSIIPVILSVYFLYQGITLQNVIHRLPRLVLAIIPMYIPILWFTYSANKKLNLSKRLIEEYAHKEVLSKTYEGLTKQITNIQDKGQSEQLKFKLLSNFLQVSSENPGKLISNYETSDHPVMEALEQSYKLQIAIDRLEGIPGLNKVAAILEKNAKKKVQEKHNKIEKALAKDAVEEENGIDEA